MSWDLASWHTTGTIRDGICNVSNYVTMYNARKGNICKNYVFICVISNVNKILIRRFKLLIYVLRKLLFFILLILNYAFIKMLHEFNQLLYYYTFIHLIYIHRIAKLR